jgi:Flp pilus assembly protein TadG
MRAGMTDERGAALVEFALVLPVVLLVLFGIAQFGVALNSANDETHLANELARYATVNQNPGEEAKETLQAWGKKQAEQIEPSFSKVEGKVCVSYPNGAEQGAPVKVDVTSTSNWFPILKLKVTHTELHGTAYMRLEGVPTKDPAGCA